MCKYDFSFFPSYSTFALVAAVLQVGVDVMFMYDIFFFSPLVSTHALVAAVLQVGVDIMVTEERVVLVDCQVPDTPKESYTTDKSALHHPQKSPTPYSPHSTPYTLHPRSD